MSLQVLVIDDSPQNRKAICGVIRSHELACVEVADMAAAKATLQAGGINFCILDLRIPADDGDSSPRRENGRLLLQWMRKHAAYTSLPVIVVTGEDKGDTEFTASVMRAGGSAVTEYMTKSSTIGEKLDQKIEWAMNLCGHTVTKEKEPFDKEPRVIELHADKVLFMGAEVWHETGQDTSARDACAILSRRDKHGYIRLNGPSIAKILKRSGSNPISTPLNRLLDRCVAAATQKGIACERADVMPNSMGGYHFTENVRVVVIGDWATVWGIEPTPAEVAPASPVAATAVPVTPRLTERQQRIQDLKTQDPKLSNEQIAKRLKVSRATVVRDKKEAGDK